MSDMTEIKEANKLRLIFYLVFILPLLYSLVTCYKPFPKNFGPYKGKVVDIDTGEPVEGAIIFFEFGTYGFGIIRHGSPSFDYEDSIYVFTDEKGEFSVSSHKMSSQRRWYNWHDYSLLTVYKPGYWSFPKGCFVKSHWGLPKEYFKNNKYIRAEIEKEYAEETGRLGTSISNRIDNNINKIYNEAELTIKFKTLINKEEIASNLNGILPYSDAPDDKLRNIKKLMNIDMIKIGRQPYKID